MIETPYKDYNYYFYYYYVCPLEVSNILWWDAEILRFWKEKQTDRSSSPCLHDVDRHRRRRGNQTADHTGAEVTQDVVTEVSWQHRHKRTFRRVFSCAHWLSSLSVCWYLSPAAPVWTESRRPAERRSPPPLEPWWEHTPATQTHPAMRTEQPTNPIHRNHTNPTIP